MNFTVSTKPLQNALDLGVLQPNISKFFQKSCLAQLTADRTTLRINLEASYVFTELVLKGSGDTDAQSTIFVDNLLLKQLVSSLDSSTLTLEFAEGGLIIHSGKSKFNVPKMIDGVDLDLTRPNLSASNASTIPLDLADWKFVKDYQMYSIAMSFVHPVYTRVWLGKDGDVLVGDFDNSIFTHSKKSKLGETCLLSDTIVNLFNSLPEGAKISKLESSYLITVATDAYEYAAEFTPQYEDDDNIGTYSADVILGMMTKDASSSVEVEAAGLIKFLNQASLLSSSAEDTITLEVSGNTLSLKDNNVDCKLALSTPASEDYCASFKATNLKSVLANMDGDKIRVCPMKQDTEEGPVVVGICCWTLNMEAVLGGVE